jgi:bifunctional non-homologous end joining protein LigD
MRDSAKTHRPSTPKSATPEAPGGGLSRYRRKRDFARTPEPAPEKAKSVGGELAFVVQKHAARTLHWDFRLEHDGVLWSWAVPKGPSMDPADRRLAVRVEDHPLAYANFEGRIPAGEYGAGTIEIWDRGTWRPESEPAGALRRGELKFTLNGTRLAGGFALILPKPRPGQRGENWLLIKERDGFALAGADAKALETGERGR